MSAIMVCAELLVQLSSSPGHRLPNLPGRWSSAHRAQVPPIYSWQPASLQVLPARTTPSPAFPRPGICRNPLALPPLRHSSAARRPVAMPATPDPGTGHQHAHARPLPARRCSMRQQRTASKRSAHCALLHRGRVDLVFSCPSGPTGLLAGGNHAAACFARLSGIRPP